jgi:hypothetical protein
MKKLILLFSLLSFFLHGHSQYNYGDTIKAEPQDTLFCNAEVVKISRVKNAYSIVINDVNSNEQYRIISLRKKKTGFRKLKKNKVYAFKLWPYHLIDVIFPEGSNLYFSIDGIELHIKNESRFSNFYLTPNLIGKQYVPLK